MVKEKDYFVLRAGTPLVSNSILCHDFKSFTFPLPAGHKYEYKVRAHNAAGPGPHSDPSLPITARPMKAAPKLDLDALNKRVRVHAGERIHVKIPYVGSPMPTATWSKADKRVATNR